MRIEKGQSMKSVIVASALVFLVARLACAQIVPCKTFDRSNTDAPEFVRDYLDGDSKRLFVRVCGDGDRRRYYGASDLVGDGHVCRYSTYDLHLLPTSPSRLERNGAPAATYMLVFKSKACPSPQAIGYYAATNGLPQDIFEHLVHVWDDAISSPASFDRAASQGIRWGRSASFAQRDYAGPESSSGRGKGQFRR
jgi:hypothetical protein